MSKLNKLLLKNNKITKILAVFAHSDDEAYLCGGLLHYIGTNPNYSLKLLTLGNKNNISKEKQDNEFTKSLFLLGVKNYTKHKVRNSEFHKNLKLVQKIISSEANKFKPDYILTYDPGGITGNPDHMVVFKEVLAFITNGNNKIKLLLRLTSRKEAQYFKTKYLMSFSPQKYINFNLSFKEMVVKLKAIFSYKRKISGFLYILHILDWYLDDTQEDYLVVDKMKNLKYKIIYTEI